MVGHTVVNELLKGKKLCQLLEGDDFDDLKAYEFDDYYKRLTRVSWPRHPADVDGELLGLVAYCKVLTRHELRPRVIAEAAAGAARRLVRHFGHLEETERRIGSNSDITNKPERDTLIDLFSRALVDLAFVRELIAVPTSGGDNVKS